MSWGAIMTNLPDGVLRYAVVVASVALLLGVGLVGIQMWRGDALICADGSVFARSCPAQGVPEAGVEQVVARALDDRLPGAIDDRVRLLTADVPELVSVPIGAIVPYFGRDEDIPSGWVLCDGRENPIGSRIVVDANRNRGGIQLPDLTARFVRGASAPLDPNYVQVGGEDEIDLQHQHRWVERRGGAWYSYDSDGSLRRVDDWGDGLHNTGSGTYPFSMGSGTRVYTQPVGGTVSNLPSYVELRFIIRIF